MLNIGRAVETILRSRLFFSGRNRHARVADPVGFAIGAVRVLEVFDPPPSTLLLAEWTSRMGQILFDPPNVGGWPGGRAWLSGRAIVARANFGAALASGAPRPGTAPFDPAGLDARQGHRVGPDGALELLDHLLTGGALGPKGRAEIVHAAEAIPGGNEPIGAVVAFVLARPEAQLC